MKSTGYQRQVLLMTAFGVCSSVLSQPRIPQLACVNQTTGDLLDGKFIENGECVDDSVWYYELSRPVIASNGLLMGAPSHFQLYFGSIGNSVQDAFDPENYGLYLEGGDARMIVELSPHFLYNTGPDGNQPAEPMWTTELAIAPANIMYPDFIMTDNPKGGASLCDLDPTDLLYRQFCAGWDSYLDPDDHNRIIVFAPEGLYGERALHVGIKFFHLHPGLLEDFPAIYYNANGTCVGTTAIASSVLGDIEYCRFDSDCSTVGTTCVPALEPFVASVTVTVLDASGNVKYKGVRSYTLDTHPRYHVAASNTGTSCVSETVETVNFQRTEPYTVASTVRQACAGQGDLNEPPFSSLAPYAPRFYLFGKTEYVAFPGAKIDNFSIIAITSTIGEFFTGNERLGVFELLQPEGANGTILEDELGWFTTNLRFGGIIFAVPIRVGGIPGKYTVRVKLLEGGNTLGAEATSTTIVVEPQENEGSSVGSIRTALSFVVPAVLLMFVV